MYQRERQEALGPHGSGATRDRAGSPDIKGVGYVLNMGWGGLKMGRWGPKRGKVGWGIIMEIGPVTERVEGGGGYLMSTRGTSNPVPKFKDGRRWGPSHDSERTGGISNIQSARWRRLEWGSGHGNRGSGEPVVGWVSGGSRHYGPGSCRPFL
eukprot:754205-Hanusia_phi.AAC.1